MQLLLFLLFPALELYLLVKVGSVTGALNMVLWVFVSALIGIWAVRVQGREAMLKVQADLARGDVPRNPFVEGLLLYLGGVLLILPGLVTDAAGLLLLVPPLRRLAAGRLGRWLLARQGRHAGASRIIFFQGFGSGGAQGPAQGTYDVHSRTVTPHAETQGGEEPPRQAVVIESTAIEIKAEDEPGDEGNPSATRSKE